VAVERDDEIGALGQSFDDMASQMEDLIGTLELRVAERTTDLELRAARLETASEVGRAAASVLDLDILVQWVVELVRESFDLYYAGLFLVDELGQFAVLAGGTGEPGRIMKEAGHKLEVDGLSMVGTACGTRSARIALDVGEESVRFDNPLLPETRSEMALPLMVGERVLGALDVQSSESAAFSQEDIVVLQLVADQVAVAIDNAHKFSEEAGLLEATSPVYRVSRRLATAVSTDEIAQVIISAVAETEADGCAVGRLDFSATGRVESAVFLGSWDRTRESGFPVGIPFSAATSPFPLEMVTSFWAVEDIREDSGLRQGSREFLARFPGRAFVNVPLRVGQQVIGFVSIYRDREGPFSPVSVRLYETLGDQAAVSLERARLLDTTRRRAEQECSKNTRTTSLSRPFGSSLFSLQQAKRLVP
jgi:GAF domain-containing protein